MSTTAEAVGPSPSRHRRIARVGGQSGYWVDNRTAASGRWPGPRHSQTATGTGQRVRAGPVSRRHPLELFDHERTDEVSHSGGLDGRGGDGTVRADLQELWIGDRALSRAGSHRDGRAVRERMRFFVAGIAGGEAANQLRHTNGFEPRMNTD